MTKREITVEKDANALDEVLCVVFTDKNGQSILAKTRDKDYAVKLEKRFTEYLKVGRPLPTYKSTYKY